MDIAKQVGTKIKHFRHLRKMSIDELAESIHKSKATVSKYENGQIIMDIVTIYDIARALHISVDQLIYTDSSRTDIESQCPVPAFFKNVSHLYLYYYDGLSNQLRRCVCVIHFCAKENIYNITLYMHVNNLDYYKVCEYTLRGQIIHYETISIMLLQNIDMKMDHFQLNIPATYVNSTTKTGLACGILSNPVMPVSLKMLISKNILEETPALIHSLKLSKEDMLEIKRYNMLVV